MGFYEVLWHGDGISDGADLEEALQGYALVKPDDGDWQSACAAAGAEPCIRRYASFEAFLDNADELETIPVTAAMIEAALADLPPAPTAAGHG
jgi:hypothetical protein